MLIKISKEKVFNKLCKLDERWQAYNVLLTNANERMKKLQYGIQSLQRYGNSLIIEALNEYKKEKLSKFVQKWDGKTPCEEMLNEMQNLEKPNHCYKFAGITVIEEDCNLCKSLNCKKSLPQENFLEMLYGIESEDTDTSDIPELQKSTEEMNEL